jgi:pyrimidine-specific ribonucleoside hydrolase
MSRPVIIDTDPGIDDAVAILLALASPELDVRALTTVAGNSTIEHTTHNAGRLLRLVGRSDIPVGRGASRPLVRPPAPASEQVHGSDGFGNAGIDDSATEADPRPAVQLITDVVEDSAEPVTLIAVGPLTNVALLDAMRPDILRRLDRIIVMGGAARGGNRLPTAEFNVWFDPEAARRVFALGLDVTMVGLDVTEQAITPASAWQPLEDGGEAAAAILAMNRFYAGFHAGSQEGRFLDGPDEPYTMQHDSLAVAAAIRPDLLRTVPAYVQVECGSPLTEGTTVVDLRNDLGRQPNAQVALGVDVPRFNELLIGRIADYLNGLP